MEKILELELEHDFKTKCFCHAFVVGASFSWCGVPRAEQEKHSGWANAGNPKGKFCCGCGLEICQKCMKLMSK